MAGPDCQHFELLDHGKAPPAQQIVATHRGAREVRPGATLAVLELHVRHRVGAERCSTALQQLEGRAFALHCLVHVDQPQDLGDAIELARKHAYPGRRGVPDQGNPVVRRVPCVVRATALGRTATGEKTRPDRGDGKAKMLPGDVSR